MVNVDLIEKLIFKQKLEISGIRIFLRQEFDFWVQGIAKMSEGPEHSSERA